MNVTLKENRCRPAYRDPYEYQPASSASADRPSSALHAGALKYLAAYHAEKILSRRQDCDPSLSGTRYLFFKPIRAQNLIALYLPGLAATFEPELRASNRWNGRGHGMLVDDELFSRRAEYAITAGLPERQAIELAARELDAKMLHEDGHTISEGYSGHEGPLGSDKFKAADVRACITGDAPRKINARAEHEAALPAFHQHDARYLRSIIHLHARAAKHSSGIKIGDVVRCEKYNLSPIEAYRLALGKELTSRQPIRDLIASSAPAAFRGLWRDDISRWYFGLTNPTPEQDQAMEQALASCPR